MNASESSAGVETASSSEIDSADAAGAAESVSIATLGELLQASEPTEVPAGADDEQSQSGSAKTATLSKFNDLAGATGLELDDLYALEVVTSEDGEPVSIQTLKDAYAGSQQDALDRIEWEETRAAEQRKLLRESAELQEIMAALPPGAIKPEVLEKIRTRGAKVVEAENALTLEVIPEWKDDKRREADIKGMTEHLQSFGFPVNYLETVVSHRQRKYFRDMWQLQERVNRALSQVRKAKPAKQPVSRNAGAAKGAPLTKETGGLNALKTVT